jgi:hypothetical protein
MALQTTAIARQWLSNSHVETPTDMNATVAQQRRNGVSSAISAELL